MQLFGREPEQTKPKRWFLNVLQVDSLDLLEAHFNYVPQKITKIAEGACERRGAVRFGCDTG